MGDLAYELICGEKAKQKMQKKNKTSIHKLPM